MEQIINSIAQITFALVAFFFVVYSILGIYTLNTYAKSRTLALGVTAGYCFVIITLLSWGWAIIL